MTPYGIEPATFRFVAEHLNQCATAVPTVYILQIGNRNFYIIWVNFILKMNKRCIILIIVFSVVHKREM